MFCISIDKEECHKKIKASKFRLLCGFGMIFIKTIHVVEKLVMEDLVRDNLNIDEGEDADGDANL